MVRVGSILGPVNIPIQKTGAILLSSALKNLERKTYGIVLSDLPQTEARRLQLPPSCMVLFQEKGLWWKGATSFPTDLYMSGLTLGMQEPCFWISHKGSFSVYCYWISVYLRKRKIMGILFYHLADIPRDIWYFANWNEKILEHFEEYVKSTKVKEQSSIYEENGIWGNQQD